MRAAKDWVRRNPAAAGVLALGALARLLWLGRPSLWSDEAVTLMIARQPASDIPGLVASLETTPALHFLLMRFWLPPWPDAMIGLRLFSALCGIAALPLYWSLCRRLAPAAATLAFFLGAFSSLWIHGAQTGRCYSLVLLLAAGQMLVALRLREGWSGREALLYAALAACGLYTHYFYGFFLLGLFVNPPERKRLAPWLAAHAAAGLCFMPGLLAALAQRRMALGIWFQNEPLNAVTLGRLLGSFLFDPAYMALALPRTLLAIGLAAATLGAAGVWRLKSELRFCLVNIAVPLAAAAVVGWINGKPAFQARYLIFLGLSVYPLLALSAERALKGPWSAVARIGLAGAAICGTCAYFASNLVFDPRLDALSAFVRRASPADEPVVHWGALEYAALRSHYLPERRHLLLDLTPGDGRYARLPGYRGVIEPAELSALGKIVVIDPERRVFAHRVGETTGPELLRLVKDKP
jgi:mannosyltransferase